MKIQKLFDMNDEQFTEWAVLKFLGGVKQASEQDIFKAVNLLNEMLVTAILLDAICANKLQIRLDDTKEELVYKSI